MAAGGEEDEAAWKSAIADAAATAKSTSSTSALRTLVLDGTVKSSTGRLPSPRLFRHVAPSLVELTIANAGLTSLAGLPRLPELRRFYLPHNRLRDASSLTAIAESCGAKLHLLDLGYNLYSDITELTPLANLGVESLDLCDCPITKIVGYRESAFKLIPSLKYLDGRNVKGDITAGVCFDGGACLASLTQAEVLGYGYHPRKIVPRIPPLKEKRTSRPVLPLKTCVPDSTALSMLKDELSKLSDDLVGIVDAAFFCKEAISLQEYFREALKPAEDRNGNRLLKYVKLPEKKTTKLKMTDEACGVLSSWVQCFTAILAAGLSWNGKFDLTHFVLLRGQVHVLKKPNPQIAQSDEKKNDGKTFAKYILAIFTLDGKYPPYLLHLIKKLQNIPDGPLMRSYRLGLDTHCSGKSSMGRVNVMYQIKIKYDGLVPIKKMDFINFLSGCKIDRYWADKVGKLDIFKKVLLWGVEVKGDLQELVKRILSAGFPGSVEFFLIRNFGTHVSANSVVDGKKVYKDDDGGTELLIPDTFGDFVADVVFNLLEDSIGQDLEIEKIAKDCMVSPIQVVYEAKNASSIINMQDTGTSYGVKEECSGDMAAEERGDEVLDQESLTRIEHLERTAQLSVFLSQQIRTLSAKLNLDVTNEVLEVEALQEKLGLSSSDIPNVAAQNEMPSVKVGIMPCPICPDN